MYQPGDKVVVKQTGKVGVIYKRRPGFVSGMFVYTVLTSTLDGYSLYEDEMEPYDDSIPLAKDSSDSETSEGIA